MTATGVAVLCYWDGRVKTKNYDVVYEGDSMKVMPIKLNYGTNYAGLLGKLYATTGIDLGGILSRTSFADSRYLQANINKPDPIENDEGVQLMLEVPFRSGVLCVEIYLQKQPSRSSVKANASTDCRMDPFFF